MPYPGGLQRVRGRVSAPAVADHGVEPDWSIVRMGATYWSIVSTCAWGGWGCSCRTRWTRWVECCGQSPWSRAPSHTQTWLCRGSSPSYCDRGTPCNELLYGMVTMLWLLKTPKKNKKEGETGFSNNLAFQTLRLIKAYYLFACIIQKVTVEEGLYTP